MSDSKGIKTHDVLGLSDPIGKLIDSVSAGIGKVYEPTHVKRMAKAKALEIQTISNAISGDLALPIIYNNGSVSMNSEEMKELAARAQNRFAFQELQKQQNIDSVVAGAYRELQKVDCVSSKPVNTDWMIRFFNSVEDISNSDLQRLWSRILAGEIRQPKSFSIRTLETLRNLSCDEAQLFQKICSVSLRDHKLACICSYSKYLEINQLTYNDILLMDECGLINSNKTIIDYDVSEDGSTFFGNEESYIVITSVRGKKAGTRIEYYPFTKNGYELSKLNPAISTKKLIELSQLLGRASINMNFSVHKIIEQNSKTIQLDHNPIT